MKNADFNRGSGVRSSTGAALLAFLLVLILSSTWLLLSDLNGHTQVYVRRADTELALNRAKQALLHYAMNLSRSARQPGERSGIFTLSRPEITTAGRKRIVRKVRVQPWVDCRLPYWDSMTRGTAAVNDYGMPCRLISRTANPTR